MCMCILSLCLISYTHDSQVNKYKLSIVCVRTCVCIVHTHVIYKILFYMYAYMCVHHPHTYYMWSIIIQKYVRTQIITYAVILVLHLNFHVCTCILEWEHVQHHLHVTCEHQFSIVNYFLHFNNNPYTYIMHTILVKIL